MLLNGLQSSPPHRPGVLQRLLRRPLKENAIIEITNLLAENEIHAVSMLQVAEVLKRHDLGFTESRPQLINIVRQVLTHLARDRELSIEDQQSLLHLQIIFELPDGDIVGVREEVLAEIYSKALAYALKDGHIDAEDHKRLATMSESFDLPESRTQDIYKAQVMKLLQLRFDEIVADRKVTEVEEAQLMAVSENLGVKLSHNHETQALFDGFKLLARIDSGDLPTITPAVRLQRSEVCHGSLVCTHSEIRQQTTSYRYSGPSASIKIMKGVRWRVGQVSVQRMTRDVMTQLDAGTLYLTSKRLLFDGAKKNTSITLGKIVNFTVFSDGIKIEKDTGRDQYFVGDGNLEVLGAVLDRLVSDSR